MAKSELPSEPMSITLRIASRSLFYVRQRPMLAVYAALLLGIAALILAFVLLWLSSKQSDHLLVVGNFLTGGTLLLAFVAGVVALQAYANASGVPALNFQFKVPSAHPNEPRFIAERDASGIVHAKPGPQMIATIIVGNDSLYAAKSPAVVIRLQEMAIKAEHYGTSGAWAVIEYSDSRDVAVIQWDGGPNYSIHGRFTRSLELNMSGLYCFPNARNPQILIYLLADGYHPHVAALHVAFSHEGTPGKPPSGPGAKPRRLKGVPTI